MGVRCGRLLTRTSQGEADRGRCSDDASAEFHDFFERHHAELARLAHLLTGEKDAADDLAADALVALWQRWDRLRQRNTRSPMPAA